MNELEYDPRTCITAGELRTLGIVIPERVPDCGWIPRRAFRVGGLQTEAHGSEVRVTMTLVFDAPFRWVEYEFEVGGS